jgi:hypothetical protein
MKRDFSSKPEARNLSQQFLVLPRGTLNDEKAYRDLFLTLDLKP